MGRGAEIHRITGETDVQLALELDGSGQGKRQTGIGFLDHMLDLLARHAAIDLTVTAKGDLHVDDHHTTEDVGICLGKAVDAALGERRGIRRYGHFTLPMDETLVTAAIDLGGRYAFSYRVVMPGAKIGTFDAELVEHFWQSFALHARCNLHLLLHHGSNAHHIAEGIFKGTARALRMAAEIDPREQGIPSTKGSL